MLKIENLNFSYGKDKVLDNYNLQVSKSNIIALKGSSGSGKSTILRLIAGLEKPKSGVIKIDGEDVTNLETHKRNIGFVFQDFALFPHLTVKNNIKFGISHLKKDEQNELIREYTKLLQIEDLLERYPHEISGGQKQRVAIARTLVTKPKLLLLDEPMSALDSDLKDSIRLFLRKILKELDITTILVTHDKGDADVICDEVIENIK